MIYLCAGLYAEGPSDYAFLLQLIPRMLHDCSSLVSQQVEVEETAVPIDAPRDFRGNRAAKIASAIQRYRGQCTIFVVHADADRDHEEALRDRVEPGRRAAWGADPIIACIPVREIEAWMLVDPGVFTALISGAQPTLPRNPEVEQDPKRTLELIYGDLCGPRRGLSNSDYDFFGANIALDRLRRLPAFVRFEEELGRAVLSLSHGARAP